MHENTGGAGGFHEGVKRAYEKGYDWLWLMDDDGKPDINALKNLFKTLKINQNIKVLNCIVLNKNNPKETAFPIPIKKHFGRYEHTYFLQKIKLSSRNGLFPWGCFFNGVLINSEVVKKIGYPKKEFFIWGDEVDYFFRVKKEYEVYIDLKAKHYHPKNRASNKEFSWKSYYVFRNSLYIAWKYYNFKCLRVLKILIEGFAFFLKNKKISLFFKGIKECLTL